jgi:hypothetical protein
MTAQLHFQPRFVRKTQLAAGEYRKNFHQIDREIIAAITSVEADQVTPLMSKIYLRLINAPVAYWERDGVLRFEAQICEEGKSLNAWVSLCQLLGVASATASKALFWLHRVGVIGYFAGKNGVGIRIFLNRAVSSIGTHAGSAREKILAFPAASPTHHRASPNEPAFNDSFAILDSSDSYSKSSAPKNGADNKVATITSQTSDTRSTDNTISTGPAATRVPIALGPMLSIDELLSRLKRDLESSLEETANRAARREHDRTREWLENRGLPKAARVAQREAYNILRRHGVISEAANGSSAQAEIGRSDFIPRKPQQLSHDEIAELAEACVAMLETKGQTIDLTLSEMSAETGGFLLPEDAGLVREKANSLVSTGIA